MKKRRRPIYRLPFEGAFLLAGIYSVVRCLPVLTSKVATLAPALRWIEISPASPEARVTILSIGTFLFGGIRSLSTFPFSQPTYLAWLRATPWRSGYPMPMGPAQLVWEDIVFATVPTLLAAFEFRSLALIPVIAGLICYSLLVVSMARLASRAGKLASYAIAFSLTSMILGVSSPIVLGLLTLCLIAWAMIATATVLNRLPWESVMAEQAAAAKAIKVADVWPLSPRDLPEPISIFDGVTISALFAWLTFCLASRDSEFTRLKSGEVIVGLVSVVAALCRLVAYGINFGSPVGLLGRIANRIWWIPKYDVIFIAPCAIVLMSFVTFESCVALQLNLPFSTAMAVAVAFAITLNAGPTRRSWQLTGHHRIIFRPVDQPNGRPHRTRRVR